MRYYRQTVTISTADPAVFTCADHNLNIGDVVILETTNTLPTGLTADVGYFVIRQGFTTSTFELSAADTEDNDGDPLATTGAGAGTNYFLKVSPPRITTSFTAFR